MHYGRSILLASQYITFYQFINPRISEASAKHAAYYTRPAAPSRIPTALAQLPAVADFTYNSVLLFVALQSLEY